jgi:uncharacterized 2Fe-2S/4Fe-4S cluster protein (DUF4445 family)
LELEELDETGYMEDGCLTVAAPVSLYAKDIRALQLAKSAICAGIGTVMRQQNADATQISTLYIAGGFGHYLNPKSAARIGLLPRSLSNKVRAVGNAALDGAALLLLDKNAMGRATALASAATTLELSTSPVFAELYMSGMLLEEV